MERGHGVKLTYSFFQSTFGFLIYQLFVVKRYTVFQVYCLVTHYYRVNVKLDWFERVIIESHWTRTETDNPDVPSGAAPVMRYTSYANMPGLHRAASYGSQDDVLRALLEFPVDLRESNHTALHHAAYAGKLDIVTLLLAFGACHDARDGVFRTAEETAIVQQQAFCQIIDLLGNARLAAGNTRQ